MNDDLIVGFDVDENGNRVNTQIPDYQEQDMAEVFYYRTIQDFIDIVNQYGYQKVHKDMGEMIARNRRL